MCSGGESIDGDVYAGVSLAIRGSCEGIGIGVDTGMEAWDIGTAGCVSGGRFSTVSAGCVAVLSITVLTTDV